MVLIQSVNFLIFVIINFTILQYFSCESLTLKQILIYNLPHGDTLRYNYEQYKEFPKLSNRTDLKIELIPVRYWAYKPKTIDVFDEPLIKLFGKAVKGMTLHLDNRTQRYQVPVYADINEHERINLVWFHKDTYDSYCVDRVGAIELYQNVKTFGRVVCTNDFYQDRCCGYEDTCQCIKGTFGCACINDEDHKRRVKMFEEDKGVVETVVEKGEEFAAKAAELFG